MTVPKLKNISISQLESFLELAGCKYIRTKGGHCMYTRCDLTRPLVFQTHIDPVPEFVIQILLRGLGYSKKDFFDILNQEKQVIKKSGKYSLVDKDHKEP